MQKKSLIADKLMKTAKSAYGVQIQFIIRLLDLNRSTIYLYNSLIPHLNQLMALLI